MRAYGFGFCVIEGGFIVLIALNWGEGDALRGVLLAWLAVHIFLSLPIIAAIPGSILGHIWQSTVKYDTRNNVISYVAKGKEDYDGGSARGPQVTVNDKNGAQADIDIQVNYSLDPKYATDLYKGYGKQTTFVKSVAAVDVRSVPREVSGRFDTIQLLTDRSKYTAAIQKALTAKWKDMGLRVEQVSVQEVRYPKSITSKYAEAQAAEIDKQKALNEQEVEKTKAETKRIKAQGEADANKVLNDSLTDNVLRQHYIDALQNADQLIVTPEGSNTLIQPK